MNTPTAEDLQSHLNDPKGYGQCCVTFSVSSRSVGDLDYDTDVPKDNQLSHDEGYRIEDDYRLRPRPGEKVSIVVVESAKGFVGYAGSYPVLFVVEEAADTEQTAAHELGHEPFGLEHTPTDDENLMYPWVGGWRLRKRQWDKVQTKAREKLRL